MLKLYAMAEDKSYDHEFGNKPSALECEVTTNKLQSLVDGNVDRHVTPEENKRILRKLDMWYVHALVPPILSTVPFFSSTN